MTKYRIFGITLPLVLAFTTLFLVPKRNGQEQASRVDSPSSKGKRKAIDINEFPVAEFSASEPTDPKRRARGKKYDKSSWGIGPETVSDNTVRVDSVDRTLAALPTSKADAIVSGTILDARAYLSNDKTGVYSTFSIVLDEIFKNPGRLSSNGLIELEREGGRVRFATGRIHLYMIAEQQMPHIGGRYVFFLAKTDDESVFEIITGYEILGDTVSPIDDLPQARIYEGTPFTNFVNELRTKLLNP